MASRSAEGDTLDNLKYSINCVLANNLGEFSSAVCPQFVPPLTVDGIMTQQGVSNFSKADQIMGAARCTITVQTSQEEIATKFDKFVLLLRNLTLDNLADLLVENLSKCVCITPHKSKILIQVKFEHTLNHHS